MQRLSFIGNLIIGESEIKFPLPNTQIHTITYQHFKAQFDPTALAAPPSKIIIKDLLLYPRFSSLPHTPIHFETPKPLKALNALKTYPNLKLAPSWNMNVLIQYRSNVYSAKIYKKSRLYGFWKALEGG